jgi:hypothetical protein
MDGWPSLTEPPPLGLTDPSPLPRQIVEPPVKTKDRVRQLELYRRRVTLLHIRE